MIVGGRVGALFFIVCFLSVLEIQIERFCISPPAWQMNEWKELGKNGQRGFEYGEFWLARASFSPFLCSFLCRRVIAYLLSSSSKKKSTTTRGGKSIFWERIPAFHFLKRDLSTVGGVLYRLKSRVLSFFFLDCRNMWQHNVSRASICDAQPIMTLGSHEIDRRNFDRWSTLIFDWNKSLKIP